MNPATLKVAIAEARRFLKAAEDVPMQTVIGTHAMAGKRWQHIPTSPQAAACKRASMDLTRALAQLRRHDQ